MVNKYLNRHIQEFLLAPSQALLAQSSSLSHCDVQIQSQNPLTWNQKVTQNLPLGSDVELEQHSQKPEI